MPPRISSGANRSARACVAVVGARNECTHFIARRLRTGNGSPSKDPGSRRGRDATERRGRSPALRFQASRRPLFHDMSEVKSVKKALQYTLKEQLKRMDR